MGNYIQTSKLVLGRINKLMTSELVPTKFVLATAAVSWSYIYPNRMEETEQDEVHLSLHSEPSQPVAGVKTRNL